MDRTIQVQGQAIMVPRGIGIRQGKYSTSIRINFCYKGVACRETLSLPASKANLHYAERLRGEILNAIGKNIFHYGDYFPHSKRARIFGHVNANPLIKDLLHLFLAQAERTLQRSTVIGYQKVCHAHLFKIFGHIRVRDLSPVFIRNYVSKLKLTTKSVRNMLIPLRAILNEAVNDDIIPYNPLNRVILNKLLDKQTRHSNYVADPFTREEIQLLLQHAQGQIRNLVQFAFFSGLRTSELIGLQWQDVDWEKKILHVRRAVVAKQEKTTKTAAGQRDVLLLPQALNALLAQKKYTFAKSARVFHHPRLQTPWISDAQIRNPYWKQLFKRSGVRYRNLYQTRHSYASMLLSAGENMLWLSRQLGHRDTEMLIKNYGRWLPQSDSQTGYQPVYNWAQVSVPEIVQS